MERRQILELGEQMAKRNSCNFHTDIKKSIEESNFDIKLLLMDFGKQIDDVKLILENLDLFEESNNIKELVDNRIAAIDGFSFLRNDIYYICINSIMPSNRKRFTIAHELGHIALGHIEDDYVAYFRAELENNGQIEIEANYFASSLLMPERKIIEYIESQSKNNRNVPQLAKKFVVSENTMYYRLQYLGLI